MASVIAVSALSIYGALFAFKDEKPVSQSSSTIKTAEDAATGLKLNYPDIFQAQALSEADRQDKFILRLTSEQPAMLVSVRYEMGMRAAAALSRQEPLAMITANAIRAFPQRYTDYALVSERSLEVADKDAHEFIFRYTGPSGEGAQQRLLIVMKDDDTAVYISAQAQESKFNELNTAYFADIFSSPKF